MGADRPYRTVRRTRPHTLHPMTYSDTRSGRHTPRLAHITLLGIAAAAITLTGQPPDAQAHMVDHRAACAEQRTYKALRACRARARRHNTQHRRAQHRIRCMQQGGPRSFCNALIAASHREGTPIRWAWDPALHWLVVRESGYNHCAVNPSRHICRYRGPRAYGYGQFLRSTERDYNCRPRPSPKVAQARCLVRYVRARYGTPAAARAEHRRKGWY